jgi:DNA-binding protein YbaB
MVRSVTASYDADSASKKIDRDVEMAQERAKQAAEAQVAMAKVRGKARTKNGEVAAEVDSNGVLTDLKLTDEALEDHPDDLARSIRDMVREAQRDAGKQTMLIADNAFGEGSPVSARMRDELEKRMR